jgi:hypothetical protein
MWLKGREPGRNRTAGRWGRRSQGRRGSLDSGAPGRKQTLNSNMKQRFSNSVRLEWQRPLSGVHFIMMEKFAKPGEGGGVRPPPFTIFTHHVQSCSVSSS